MTPPNCLLAKRDGFNKKWGAPSKAANSRPPPECDIPPIVSHRFTFPDWFGNEDVLQLCDLYLKHLERAVADGQSKGFLTK
jgi:hypothetical protein